MSNPSPTTFTNPTPYQLRSLVLDYLCHSCYTRTASAFNRDSISTIRQLDADGDEIIDDVSGMESSTGDASRIRSDESFETLLQQVRLRQEIRTRIMSGRVDDAITLLNTHFPSVLSADAASTVVEDPESRTAATSNIDYVSSTSTEPAHLHLNLKILAFSEACRTMPLDYPPTVGTPLNIEPPEPSSDPTSEGDVEASQSPIHMEQQQMALLTRAQKLYAISSSLPNLADRETYRKELANVSGLLAYKVPEKSSMAKYLTQERREAVADQINRAILKRTNKPLVSSVEFITRQTQLVWQTAHDLEVKARPGAILPPRGKTTDSDSNVVPTFDLHQFLDVKP